MTTANYHSEPLVNAASRHRWKVLAAGVAANASFSVAFSGLPMTAVLMRTAYHLDNATLGLMLGLMGLGIALSELPWGMLTDRWGDRPVLLLGLGSTALALLAMCVWAGPVGAGAAAQAGWPLLGAGLVLVGLLGGSVNGASGRAVMSWFSAQERGLAMSIRQTAVPMGGAIGALLLPWLAGQGGFGWIYGLLAALCAVSAALCWAWVHEPDRKPVVKDSAAALTPTPLRDPTIWRMVAGIGLLCAPQFAVLSFGTVFLHDFARLGLVPISAAMAAVQLGAMGLRIWSGRWTDQRGNRPAYLRACALFSVAAFMSLSAMALLSSTTHPGGLGWLLGSLLVLSGLIVSAWHGVAYAELGTRAGAAQSGTALGMANTSVFLVCFLTPIAIPHLLALQGWPLVWLAAGLVAMAARPLLAPRRSASKPVFKTLLSS